jgi:hypothetical protein
MRNLINDGLMLAGVDGYEPESDEEIYMAIQNKINMGLWGGSGSEGRQMMDAITNGYCMLGETDARDYYGNHIPSRSQVQEGTKGSYDFVAERMGTEWADMMKDVK